MDSFGLSLNRVAKLAENGLCDFCAAAVFCGGICLFIYDYEWQCGRHKWEFDYKKREWYFRSS